MLATAAALVYHTLENVYYGVMFNLRSAMVANWLDLLCDNDFADVHVKDYYHHNYLISMGTYMHAKVLVQQHKDRDIVYVQTLSAP